MHLVIATILLVAILFFLLFMQLLSLTARRAHAGGTDWKLGWNAVEDCVITEAETCGGGLPVRDS